MVRRNVGQAECGLASAKTYALIHRLQPAALIIPNHHQTPKPGEDVQTFERDLPGQNTAGFNTKFVTAIAAGKLDTLNDSWGFTIGDDTYESPEEVEEAGAGGGE